MVVRRFVYDEKLGAVVELGEQVVRAVNAGEDWRDALGQWKSRSADDTGLGLRNAALERADRRVYAHKRFGDEHRWTQ